MDFYNNKNITIFSHPLIKHKISLLRDRESSTNKFRQLVEEIAMLEAYEALKDLPPSLKGSFYLHILKW